MSSGQNNEDESGSDQEGGFALMQARRNSISNLVSKHGNVLAEPVPEALQRLIEQLKENERRELSAKSELHPPCSSLGL